MIWPGDSHSIRMVNTSICRPVSQPNDPPNEAVNGCRTTWSTAGPQKQDERRHHQEMSWSCRWSRRSWWP